MLYEVITPVCLVDCGATTGIGQPESWAGVGGRHWHANFTGDHRLLCPGVLRGSALATDANLKLEQGEHQEEQGEIRITSYNVCYTKLLRDIIRQEMDAAGGQEIFMTVLQDRETWEKTGRWSDEVVDNWFKTELKNGTQLVV